MTYHITHILQKIAYPAANVFVENSGSNEIH